MSQSKAKFLRYFGRGKSATTAEAKAAEPAARDARAPPRPRRATTGYTAEHVLDISANSHRPL